jgi:outer membrane protein assembly factor BamB
LIGTLALSLASLPGCGGGDDPAGPGAIDECDWPMWGHGPSRTFSYPCDTALSPGTAGELEEMWFFNAEDAVTATPAVVDGMVYVGDWSGNFYALDLETGERRWTFRTRVHPRVYAGQIVSSAAVANVAGERTVYFGAGNTLYALRAGDGDLRWDHRLAPPGDDDDPREIESSPVVVDGMVIFGSDVHNADDGTPAAVFALDAATGEERWSYQPHEPNRDDLDFAGAPNLFDVAGRAAVGLGNKDAVYYAVDRATGEPLWDTRVAEPGIPEPGSDYSTGGFIGPTALADGAIVGGTAVGGAPYLHAIDAASGGVLWQQDVAGPTYAAAVEANGVVFIGGTDFTFRALDLRNGDVLWERELSGAVSGGAVVVGDDVIAVAGIRAPGVDTTSDNSGVYRFSLGSGGGTAPSE